MDLCRYPDCTSSILHEAGVEKALLCFAEAFELWAELHLVMSLYQRLSVCQVLSRWAAEHRG